MGGGGRFPFPKFVWTPTGGWWGTNPHWKKHLAFAFGLYAVFALPMFKLSATSERRAPPARPLPSQIWGTHTLEDDPKYTEKVEEWNQKKPVLQRIFGTDSGHH